MEVIDKHLRLGMEVRFSNVSSLGGITEGDLPPCCCFSAARGRR